MSEAFPLKFKTPLVVIGSRLCFFVYFIVSIPMWWIASFPETELSYAWTTYLGVIYLGCEYLYAMFLKRGIDLSFAFPLLFAVYCLNLVSMIVGGQENLPVLNRAEHFTSFVLLTYVVWIFFTKYLPQKVWQEHPYYTSILVFSIASAVGVFNEMIELFLDVVFKTRTIGSGFDTNIDLVMNSLGSILFLFIRLLYSMWEDKKT